MTTISEKQNDDLRLWLLGLASGASAVLLPSVAVVVVCFAVSWRQEYRLTLASFVRLAAGFMLAMIVCNILKEWPAFYAGLIDGFHAVSK